MQSDGFFLSLFCAPFILCTFILSVHREEFQRIDEELRRRVKVQESSQLAPGQQGRVTPSRANGETSSGWAFGTPTGWQTPMQDSPAALGGRKTGGGRRESDRFFTPPEVSLSISLMRFEALMSFTKVHCGRA